MIFLALWVLALLSAAVHVGIRRQWSQALQRTRVFLCYQLTIALGLSGILVFVGHALRPAETAARIGWPASPNFQFELGGFGLGLAVAALLCLLIRSRFYWLGVALTPSIFLVVAGLNHLREALGGNLAPYNVLTAAPDLLIPLTLGWLFFRLFRLAPSGDPDILTNWKQPCTHHLRWMASPREDPGYRAPSAKLRRCCRWVKPFSSA